MTAFKEYRVTQIDGHTWHISDQINAYIYLLEGREKALVIDTGIGVYPLMPVTRGLTAKPLIVVHTHWHIDHAGADYEFDDVFIHEKDYEMLMRQLSGKATPLGSHRDAIMTIGEGVFGKMPDCGEVEQLLGNSERRQIPEVHLVKGGDCFELGGRCLEVIEVPGHTPGSIFLLERERGSLYTGDGCCSTYGVLFDLPGAASVEEYLAALESVWDMRDAYEMLYPAHHDWPLDKGYIEEFIACARQIVDGKAGEPKAGAEGIFLSSYRRAVITYPESQLKKYHFK
ncbi:MAG: MBL fold metallo-hydrolase [Ruminococcus flavefaciens]|nr:MBL fold metallo-hydrolase [Ruminococcus flavefaciens]